MRDFISLADLNPRQWNQLLHLSREVKSRPPNFRRMIPGKSIVLIFEKPSLRTRLTFELGIQQLGGDAVYLDYQEANLGEREALRDVAKNLERWFDCLVARTFSHQVLIQLSEYARCSVINALTDAEHPCQALADIFTLTEKWSNVEGRTLAYIGDGNNVCASLVHAAALSGMCFTGGDSPKPAALCGLGRGFSETVHQRSRLLSMERFPRRNPGSRCRLYRHLGQHGPGNRGSGETGRIQALSGDT